MSPRKRAMPVEFDDISAIEKPTEGYNGLVHGVVTALSPMQESSKVFFDGYMSNGRKKCVLWALALERSRKWERSPKRKRLCVLRTVKSNYPNLIPVWRSSWGISQEFPNRGKNETLRCQRFITPKSW